MKHWVFDLDGTLVDSHSVYFDSLRKILKTYEVDLSDSDKAEVLRIAVKDRPVFFEKKLGTRYAAEALRAFELCLLSDDQKISEFSGIPALLEKLKLQKCKIGLWTAREMPSAKRVLKHTNLDPFFDFHMSGSCVSVCKPSPEGLIRIAEEFKCETNALTMVGDHDNDMFAAKACGARAIRAVWNDPNLSKCVISDFKFSEVESLTSWI